MRAEQLEAVLFGWPARPTPPAAPRQRPQATPAEAHRNRVLEMASRHRLPDDTPVWTRSPSGLVLRHRDRWAAYEHVASRPGAGRHNTTFHDHNPAQARKRR
jgi:hypothetical protein